MSRGGQPLPKIADYGIIGDAGSAALIARDGSIDWLCWPNFHSPSLFARLLDSEAGGYFHIRPTSEYRVERRYLPDTAILETTFHCPEGTLILTDFMVALRKEQAEDSLHADHRIVRRAACAKGRVELEVVCDLRPNYARINPPLEDRGALGFFYAFGSEVVRVFGEAQLVEATPGVISARFALQEGEVRRFSLCYDSEEPAVLAPLGDYADIQLDETAKYWRSWAKQCDCRGRYRNHLVRSVITLKLLTHASTGAVVAAATTSLPEAKGGERNWDYRYCWPRDAVFTLRALSSLGFSAEARAFFDWLMLAVGPKAKRLRVLFDVFGGQVPREQILHHLSGYQESRPVRVGNQAVDQFQLDIYGEILGTAREYVERGGSLDSWQQRLLRSLGQRIVADWKKPDAGIWEKRSAKKRHTYSTVMCWSGLDCLLELADRGKLRLPEYERFKQTRAEIEKDIENHGFNRQLGCYVDTFDGTDVDASLLLLPTCGYVDARDPKMVATFERIQKELGRGPLLHRYVTNEGRNKDGLPGEEATFAMCAFWMVDYLAMAGRLDEAYARLDQLLEYGNDLELFAEEIDAATGEYLGNFPQAFTHVGLIDAIVRCDDLKALLDEGHLPSKRTQLREDGKA